MHILFLLAVLLCVQIKGQCRELTEKLYKWKTECFQTIKELENDPIWTQREEPSKEELKKLQEKLDNLNVQLYERLSNIAIKNTYPYTNYGNLAIMFKFQRKFDPTMLEIEAKNCWLFKRSASEQFLEVRWAQLRSLISGLMIDLNTFVIEMELAWTQEEFRQEIERLDGLCKVETLVNLIDALEEVGNDPSNSDQKLADQINFDKIRQENQRNELYIAYSQLGGKMLAKMMAKIQQIRIRICHSTDCDNHEPNFYSNDLPFKTALSQFNALADQHQQKGAIGKVKMVKELQGIWAILMVDTKLEALDNESANKLDKVKLLDRQGQTYLDGEALLRLGLSFGREFQEIKVKMDKLPQGKEHAKLLEKFDDLQKTVIERVLPWKSAMLSELDHLNVQLVEKLKMLKDNVDTKMKRAATLSNIEVTEELNKFTEKATEIYTMLDRHSHLGIPRFNLCARKERMGNLLTNLEQSRKQHLIEIKAELLVQLSFLDKEVKTIGETKKRLETILNE